MNARQQSEKITRAIHLSRQIADLSKVLDALKQEFREEAEKEIIDRHDEKLLDVAGQSWTFTAEDGAICKVAFPSAGLVRSFIEMKGVPHKYVPDPNNPKKDVLAPIGLDLRDFCGAAFNKLFACSWKPAKAFRELVPALITPESRAKKLLDALTEPGGTARVSFEVKETM